MVQCRTQKKNVRIAHHNIVVRLPVARKVNKNEPIDIWNSLFSDGMVQMILQWTNKKLSSIRTQYKLIDKTELKDLNEVEFRAFLGLLLFTSIFKSNTEDVDAIFATDGTGRELFRATMSKERFLVILGAMRFDNYENRLLRRTGDLATAITDFFDLFINNCQQMYSVGTCCCIDEMLVTFRGKCSFKVYIPNKPGKYGMKIMCMTDARTSYLYNAYIYSGKDSDGRGLPAEEKKYSKPTQSVLRLSQPIYGTNRNITADNWFSSIEVIDKLKQKSLTYVGTVRKNKKELPSEFLPNKNREIESTIYGFTSDKTLISHVPKKNKAVILVSSMHHQKCTDALTKKPEIIAFYNNTKGGVDSLDEKCAKYSCSRRTRRWPMAIFYKVVDICSSNAFVIYQSHSNTEGQNTEGTRFAFIKDLAFKLITPHLEKRLNNPRISKDIRSLISRILKTPEVPDVDDIQETLERRKTCIMCPASLKRKSKYVCMTCKGAICLQCARKFCAKCSGN